MGKLASRAAILLSLALFWACAASKKPEASAAPETSTTFAALGPTTLESSAPISPEWVMRSTKDDSGALSFVGQSNAPTLDAAKGRAERELLAAISSYVAVDVESDMEDVSWSHNGSEGQSIKSKTKTKTSAALAEIRPDAHYWERVASSPLAVSSADYRYYLHASVSKAELARVRMTKLASRRTDSGKQVVAVLPFRGVGASTTAEDLIARGLFEETGRLLARSPALHLSEESVVRAAIGDATRDGERAERVKSALLPDWLVRAAVTSHGSRLRVSVSIEDGSGKVQTFHLIRPASALPRFARELGLAVLAKIGAPAGAQKVAAPVVRARDEDAAFRAYHEAGIKFQSGALDEALARIKKAIELSPEHAPSYMRLGRILERMGRFAKIPPTPQQPHHQEYLSLCSQGAVMAQQRALTALNERAAKLSQRAAGGGAPSWWTDTTPLVDQVLDAVIDAAEEKAPQPYSPRGVQMFSFDDPPEWVVPQARKEIPDEEPEEEAVVFPSSAVEAYARAEHLYSQQNDGRGAIEAALVLADLAARVDRYDHALWLYRHVGKWAERMRDPHFESLAHYGRAISYRKRTFLLPARDELLLALKARAKLGEKPYVLEIYNELGSVALSLSEYDAAEALYRLALRIADELSSDYLQSILANNLGAVEWARGQTTEATERFQRAADRLTDLRESEGRITATLNLAASAGMRAELDQADLLYQEINRMIQETQQEGRIAEQALHQGAFDVNRGKWDDGAQSLALSYHLYQRIGRRTESMRARDAIYAAEYYSKGQDRADVLRCMKTRYWGLDAAAFEPEAVIDGDQEPAPSPFASTIVPARELIFALDAAAIVALDPTKTDYDRAVVFSPPQTTPPAESDPRAQARRQREEEERRKQLERQRIHRHELDFEDEEVRGDLDKPSVAPPMPKDEPATSVIQEVLVTGSATSESDGLSLSLSAAEPARQTIQVAKTVDYERILGAFTIEADVLILLDPPTVEKHAVARLIPSARRVFAAISAVFEQRGAKRHYAVAQLNDGALAWAAGDGEGAYASLMNAERAFADVGDARGLAHVHAWLAHLFETSGAQQIAAEHRWVSEQLFMRALAR